MPNQSYFRENVLLFLQNRSEEFFKNTAIRLFINEDSFKKTFSGLDVSFFKELEKPFLLLCSFVFLNDFNIIAEDNLGERYIMHKEHIDFENTFLHNSIINSNHPNYINHITHVDYGNNAENDPVNNPSHYTDGKIEVIDFIEDKKLNFHRGNAVKYIARTGKKDPSKEIEDLEKAQWYLNREIQKLKTEKSLYHENGIIKKENSIGYIEYQKTKEQKEKYVIDFLTMIDNANFFKQNDEELFEPFIIYSKNGRKWTFITLINGYGNSMSVEELDNPVVNNYMPFDKIDFERTYDNSKDKIEKVLNIK